MGSPDEPKKGGIIAGTESRNGWGISAMGRKCQYIDLPVRLPETVI